MPPRKKRSAQVEQKAAEIQDVNPEKMKVADLKAELEKRGLNTSGKKADLIKTLKEALGTL